MKRRRKKPEKRKEEARSHKNTQQKQRRSKTEEGAAKSYKRLPDKKRGASTSCTKRGKRFPEDKKCRRAVIRREGGKKM